MEREQGKRRPRISEGKVTGRDGNPENFEKVNYNRNEGNQRIMHVNRMGNSNEGEERLKCRMLVYHKELSVKFNHPIGFKQLPNNSIAWLLLLFYLFFFKQL